MSLEDIPSYFATATGMNEATAQMILTVFIIVILLFPYLILTKGEPDALVSLIFVFLGLTISLGFGWAPFWVMIMIIALTASGIAFLGARVVTGGNS